MIAASRADGELIAQALEVGLVDSRVERQRPLGELTTYRVGGPAEVFVDVESERDLRAVAAVTSRHRPRVLVVGRGSNLLVADAGVAGLVIRLGAAFSSIDVDAEAAHLGGAASLPVASRQLSAVGLSGFEWAVGVPGSAGGALRMNAGGHGSDMAASVQRARIVDLHSGEDAPVLGAELDLSYRSSSVAPHQLVAGVTLDLAAGDPAVGAAEIRSIVQWRRDNQPGGQNAGSVFTNPPGDSAGRLIDAAGLRGHRVRTAEVSAKHANFIQADPDGCASDIVELMRLVVRRVEDHAGVVLHPETAMVGFEHDDVGAFEAPPGRGGPVQEEPS